MERVYHAAYKVSLGRGEVATLLLEGDADLDLDDLKLAIHGTLRGGHWTGDWQALTSLPPLRLETT